MIRSESKSLFDLLSLAPDLAVLVTCSSGVVISANTPARSFLRLDAAQIGRSNILSLLVAGSGAVLDSFADFVQAAVSGLTVRLSTPGGGKVSVRVIELEQTPLQYAVSLTPVDEVSGSYPSSGGSDSASTSNPDLLLSVAEEISEFGCFSWDMVEDRLEWSDGLFRIFGVNRADFSNKGEEFFNRIHPQDHWKIREALAEAVKGDGDFQNTERILRSDGDIRWLQSQGRLRVDARGTALQLTGVCRDITDKVQSGNDLRTQIDDRRALESQLLQTQKLEAIGKLSSGIAHDFNNLLTVISSGCDFLKLLPPEAVRKDARRLVQTIQDAGDRASQLTSQLLLYSRSTTGQPQAVCLNTAVEQSREFLQRTLSESITFSLDLHSDAPVLYIDPTQLQQILLNLALNARDAMPEGGLLSMQTDMVTRASPSMNDDKLSRHAMLRVIDAGIGVTEELQSRMFDPFYTTKPIGAGSGLGLSVVWGIVHAAGGTIEVDSEIGKGTEFRIYLPVSADRQQDSVASSARVMGGDAISILVVEDEAAILTIIQGALEYAGFHVTGFTDPMEAVRFAADPGQRVDMLISDVSMPALSGPELVQSIHGVRPASSFPVLFISGNDERTLKKTHGVNAEESNFMQKPFRIASLISKVRNLLSTTEAGS